MKRDTPSTDSMRSNPVLIAESFDLRTLRNIAIAWPRSLEPEKPRRLSWASRLE
jgi:hypothetical protein